MIDPMQVQATGEFLQLARDFAQRLVGPSLDQFGGILGDHVAAYRCRNQIRLFVKTKVIAEANGIQPEKILPDVFVPLVEAASNVEAEELADMFASLLATHLDPATQADVHPAFAKVLAQLAACDAAGVSLIHDLVLSPEGTSKLIRPVNLIARGFSQDLAVTIVENLERLGLLREVSPDILPFEAHNQPYTVTRFGATFARACHHGRGIGTAAVREQ